MGPILQSEHLGSGQRETTTKISLLAVTSEKRLNNSDPMTPIKPAQPLGSLTDTSKSIPSQTSSTRDTFVVLLTLTVISITLYFSYYLWKKHRHRSLSAASKLEEYRYSRLSQNEIDVDNVQFSDPLCPDDSLGEPEFDEGLKPATLQLETDALITITDSHISQAEKNQSKPTSNGHVKSVVLIDDLSDEDLLLQ